MKHEGMNDAGMHWTDEALLDRLYGLDAAPEFRTEHLEACGECAARWAGLQTRHEAVMETPAVSDDLLRAQRQAVWAKIENTKKPWLTRAVPVAATAMLLMLAVSLQRTSVPPPTETQTAEAAVSDTQLFTELAQMTEAESPRGADPLRALFVENQQEKAQ